MKKIKLLLLGSIICLAPASIFSQNGLHFDGTNDYVQTTYNGVSGNGARTIEAWIKTTENCLPASSGGNGQRVIVDYGTFATGQRFTMNLLWSNSIRLEVSGGGISGTLAVNDGLWHHVAVVHNPTATSNILLYIDGVLNTSGSLGVNTGTANKLMIGRRVDGVNNFLGDIDEVRVWNVAKTQAQIAASMNSEICGSSTGLVAYYKLNEGIAGGTNTGTTTTADEIANANGTLLGFGLTGATSNWVTGAALPPGNATFSQTFNECAGFSITVGSNTYTTTGNYADTLFGATFNGCDSIINTHLTIATASDLTYNQTFNECAGFSITVGSNTYTTTGNYADTLLGASAAGCDSIINTNLTIAAPIDTTITVNPSDLTANQTGATYQWLNCDSNLAIITGATNQTYTGITNGNYAVEITMGSCIDTSICATAINVGINEAHQTTASIHPNPTTHSIQVNLNRVETVLQYSLISIDGKILETKTLFNTSSIAIDMSHQAKGMYLLKLNNTLYKVNKQ